LGFVEAFKKMGYKLEYPRQDWSASSETGVCISLKRVEIKFAEGTSWLDTRLHSDPIDTWENKHGNTKRKRHLQRSLDVFGGFIDVVITDETSAGGNKNANPWFPNERGLRWRIVDFDESTGHFEVKAEAICEN
jgi:hypothetical protein